jgi:hypothetical protein
MIAPVIIKLNGVLIESDIDGVESFEVTYRESDEQGILTKSYSTELTFYGIGYNLLRAALIDNPNGFIGEVRAEVFDECCGRLVLDGIIRGDSIDWCEPECWIKAQIIEKQPELDCVQSTLITDNSAPDFFMNRPQKKLRYCVEMRPQFITEILLQLYFLLYIMLIPVVLAVATFIWGWQGVLFIICSIVCAVPGTGCDQTDCNTSPITNPIETARLIGELMDDLSDRLIQCQWYHPTALVRDYIENVCRKCGLTFQSSILNDPSSPYYNLLLFSAPVRKGYKPSGTEPRLIADNVPIETLDTLFQRYLKPLFNARYWIIDGVLIFERRDYFQNSNTWIDAENLLNNGKILDNRICFSWIDDEKYAYAKYTYLQDGADLLAYEAADRYNTIVEWNDPPSAAQKGFMDNQFGSGIARFRDDRAGWEATGFTGIINTVMFNALANSRDTLLMSQHTAFNYKFLIWDEFSGDETARIKRDYSTGFTGGDVIGDVYYNVSNLEGVFEDVPLDPTKLFNYPMWFNENNTNNLYTLFHYINNPRTPGNRLYNFSFEFEFDCAQFDAISFSKNIRLRVGSMIKFGEIKELKIDFMKRTIDVSGIV